MKTVILILLTIVLVGISYLGTVGVMWVLLWLGRKLFEFNFDPNIWIFGLFIWIVVAILKSIFQKK